MRITKAVVIVALLFFSGGIFATIQSGSLYPWIIIGTGTTLGFIAIMVQFDFDRRSFAILLSVIVALAVLYRAYIYAFPATLIGVDPHDFATWLEQILDSGGLDGTSAPGFYTTAPLYLVLSAIGSQILALEASAAFVLMSVIIGVGTSLWGAALVRRQVPHVPQLALAAAIGAGFLAASIRTGYWPIPQSLAAIYFVTFIYVLITYLEEWDSRNYILATLLLTALAATHKLALVVVVAALGYVIPLTMVFSYRGTIPRRSLIATVGSGLLSGVFFYTQMSSTGYIISVAYRILSLGDSGGAGSITPSAAVPPMDPLFLTLYSVGYALVLMTIAGIAWIVLLSHRPTRGQIVLLGATSGIVSLGVIGMVVGEFGFKRVMDYGGVILVALIMVTIGVVYERRQLKAVPRPLLTVGIVAILLISSFGATAVAPDYNNSQRDYLTAGEAQAVAFGEAYGNGEIKTDHLAAQYGSPVGDRDDHQYQAHDVSHLNGERADSDYILFRPDAEVYDAGPLPTRVSSYQLTWSPESAYDQSHHRTYSSGDGIIYANQTATR